jgi:hypothetical protein
MSTARARARAIRHSAPSRPHGRSMARLKFQTAAHISATYAPQFLRNLLLQTRYSFVRS